MARAFSELSDLGQIRRVRAVAERAAAIHGLTSPRLTLIQHSENAVYRADESGTGRRFALRVHRTDYHSVDELRSELAWLEALDRDGLAVPRPVRGPDGDLLVFAGTDDVPALPCSLLTWVHGRMRRKARRPQHMVLLGGLLARMHEHARAWERPAWFTRKPLGWPELFTDTAVAGVDADMACEAFTSEQRELFEAVRASLDPADLGPPEESSGLIHADLHFANVVFANGAAVPIDFDDCAIGPWVLDLATTVAAVSDAVDFSAMREALLHGYEEHAPLPAALSYLDHFIAGRFVLLALFVAANGVHNPVARKSGARWIAHFFDGARRFLPTA